MWWWVPKILGGCFKYFLFSPLLGEDSHFDSYFSRGLVQPPTRIELWNLKNFTHFQLKKAKDVELELLVFKEKCSMSRRTSSSLPLSEARG